MAKDPVNMDISKTELEFRMMIIKVLAGLEKSMENTRESLSIEIKSFSGEKKELKFNQ